MIFTGDTDGNARLWDATTGQPIGGPLPHGGRKVNAVAFSPDGKLVLTGSSNKTAQLWDAVTGEMLKDLPKAHGAEIDSGYYSPDGRWAAVDDEAKHRLVPHLE